MGQSIFNYVLELLGLESLFRVTWKAIAASIGDHGAAEYMYAFVQLTMMVALLSHLCENALKWILFAICLAELVPWLCWKLVKCSWGEKVYDWSQAHKRPLKGALRVIKLINTVFLLFGSQLFPTVQEVSVISNTIIPDPKIWILSLVLSQLPSYWILEIPEILLIYLEPEPTILALQRFYNNCQKKEHLNGSTHEVDLELGLLGNAERVITETARCDIE